MSARDIIALSKGTFDEYFEISIPVTVWGACAAETHLTTSIRGDLEAVVIMSGRASELRNVRISGPRIGVGVIAPATAQLRNVLIDGAELAGVFAEEGSTLTAEDLIVRRTRSSFNEGVHGEGLHARLGASVVLNRAVFEENRHAGHLGLRPGNSCSARRCRRSQNPRARCG